MLISCPKCSAVYMVSDNQVPEEGKRFKCAECGKVWTVSLADIKNLEPETQQVKSQIVRPATAYDVDEEEIQRMFSRISQDTKSLFNEKEAGNHLQRILRKLQVIFSPTMLNGCIFVFIFIFTLFIGYYNRYDIVRIIPRLEYFYNRINVESVYVGKDIEFQDLKLRNIDKNRRHYVEVSGRIFNKGKYKSKVLPIIAELKHLDGTIATEAKKTLTLKALDAEYGSLFRILLLNKTTDAKKIYLSFDNTFVETKAVTKNDKKEKTESGSGFSFGMNKDLDKF